MMAIRDISFEKIFSLYQDQGLTEDDAVLVTRHDPRNKPFRTLSPRKEFTPIGVLHREILRGEIPDDFPGYIELGDSLGLTRDQTLGLLDGWDGYEPMSRHPDYREPWEIGKRLRDFFLNQ